MHNASTCFSLTFIDTFSLNWIAIYPLSNYRWQRKEFVCECKMFAASQFALPHHHICFVCFVFIDLLAQWRGALFKTHTRWRCKSNWVYQLVDLLHFSFLLIDEFQDGLLWKCVFCFLRRSAFWCSPRKRWNATMRWCKIAINLLVDLWVLSVAMMISFPHN
jgi:hypothetical protein